MRFDYWEHSEGVHLRFQCGEACWRVVKEVHSEYGDEPAWYVHHRSPFPEPDEDWEIWAKFGILSDAKRYVRVFVNMDAAGDEKEVAWAYHHHLR